jgi:glycosyltransferase involved in cell wall biosynthesis
MNSQPLVSVIALNHNQGKFLEETLDSVRNQTYKNIELIICDDFSTEDDSKIKITKWVERNPERFRDKPKLIFNEQNLGVTKSSNKAVKEATGYYICFIACDDVILPDKLSTLVDEFSTLDSSYMAIYTDAQMINEDGKPYSDKNFIEFHRTFSIPPSGFIFDVLKKNNFIPWPSLLIKNEAYKKVGYFDENLFLEDWDFLLRLSKYYKIHYYPYISAKYRVHSSNFNVCALLQATYRYDAFRVTLKHSDVTYFKLMSKIMLLQFYFRADIRFTEMLDLYRKNIGNSVLSKILSFNAPFNLFKKLRVKNTTTGISSHS